jgi:hypothetical protein
MCEEEIREDLTVVELTDKELDEVTGALYDGFGPYYPSNNSTSLAVTSVAFTTSNNNNGWW